MTQPLHTALNAAVNRSAAFEGDSEERVAGSRQPSRTPSAVAPPSIIGAAGSRLAAIGSCAGNYGRGRRGLFLLTLAAMAVALVPADARVNVVSQTRADIPVDQPLRGFYAALEAAMKAGRTTPFPLRFEKLAPVVDEVFDLETVLKVSVGLRWDSMDPEVRDRLFKTFRRFTIATYVANFDKYDGEHFEVLPGARDLGSDRVVDTAIVTSGGQRLRLDYVMRDGNGAWKAVDVLLEGSISRVAVQRSDFRKLLATGDADALIASLQRKIVDLSDGALSS